MDSNIYLFYGDEKYDLNKEVQKIKDKFNKLEIGINFFIINNENIDKLNDIIEGTTFFGDEKLIIIKDTNLKFDVIILKDLDKNIIILIIEDSIDKRLSAYKVLSKISNCKEFKKLDEKSMSLYICKLFNKYNIKCSNEIANYMVEKCGVDKTNNINEIMKVVIYLGQDGVVTKEIIDKICTKTLDAKIFDVLDMIIKKDKINGLNMLDEILKQKESIVKIYIMLYKQIKQIYMIKLLKEKKCTNIDKKLNIHPYVYKKLESMCNIYNINNLKNIIYLFDEYDEKTKIGEMDFEIGLKKIICAM